MSWHRLRLYAALFKEIFTFLMPLSSHNVRMLHWTCALFLCDACVTLQCSIVSHFIVMKLVSQHMQLSTAEYLF